MNGIIVNKGRRLIAVNTDEVARLMRLSMHRSPLALAFGTPYGTMINLSDTSWAEPLLAEWRGEVFVNGAGI